MNNILINYANAHRIILDLNNTDDFDNDPLKEAAKKGNLELIKLLIHYADNNNIKLNWNSNKTNDSHTPLQIVLQNNYLDVVLLLINYGRNNFVIDFNISNEYGYYTLLELGFNCCYNQNPKVEKDDDIGNWAKENGEWCVVKEDSYGKWGEEDGELCDIGEMNRDITYRIRNIQTKQCVLVNNSDGNLINFGECTISNHSLWCVTNIDEYNKITYVKNGKCLYVANACTSVVKHLNFEELYDKNDEIFQWEIQDIDNGVISRKENDPYNPDRNNDPPKKNTDVVYTDETSSWGVENNDWCLITDSSTTISTTTTTVEPTSTPTNSESSVTVKPEYAVYWFYHALTNKCLYAPQEPNKPITVKPCDESNYSKWMVLTLRKGYFIF
ncbi:Non-catalytic module family DOC2 [Piromyces sp. E2]|nr:Non-catalytic module family DOC2 [Piromyces sp. E2]|eukprot:OUM57342.1 Non-catalytic module family DOC2 [Piromyces sp. E2]